MIEGNPALRAADAHNVAVPVPQFLDRARSWLLILIVIALLAVSWGPTEMSKVTLLVSDWRNMAEFASGFMSPDFRDWRVYLYEMLETVQIAVWGTALAVLFGAPLAILSSSNICPNWVVQPVRRLMDASRAINEIVFALLFVVAVGLGPLAGVLAGMDWAAPQGEWLLSVAADCPFLPLDLVSRLAAAQRENDSDIIVASSGGQAHPVIALWRVGLREVIGEIAESQAG